MNTYTIRKGKHGSFKSLLHHTKVLPYTNFRKIKVDVQVLYQSLYDTKDDTDLIHDWNKFPGVSAYLWPSNKTFATLAWRSTGNSIQVVPYANLNDEVNRYFPPEIPNSIFEFKPGESFYYEIELQDANFIVSLFTGENTLLTSHAFEAKAMSRYIRTTSLWFGGDDNDNNNLGGVAPSTIKFKLDHNLIKT